MKTKRVRVYPYDDKTMPVDIWLTKEPVPGKWKKGDPVLIMDTGLLMKAWFKTSSKGKKK